MFSPFCKSFVINGLNGGEIALCHLMYKCDIYYIFKQVQSTLMGAVASVWDFFSRVLRNKTVFGIFFLASGRNEGRKSLVALQGENIPVDGARAVAQRQLGTSYNYTTPALQCYSNIPTLLMV